MIENQEKITPDIKVTKKRPKRVPLSKQKSLSTTQRHGYERRWVNIVEDRIDRFKLAGWSPVVGKSNLNVDAKAHDSNYDSDSAVIRNVGAGRSDTKAMLMEIPDKFYQEDQLVKQNRVDEIENAYSPSKKASRDPNRYDESNH